MDATIRNYRHLYGGRSRPFLSLRRLIASGLSLASLSWIDLASTASDLPPGLRDGDARRAAFSMLEHSEPTTAAVSVQMPTELDQPGMTGVEWFQPTDESRWLTLELPSWLGESRLKPLPAVDGPQTLMRWSYGDDEEPTHKLEDALATDRPDFTEASTTVGKGVLQVEFGYTYTFDREGNDIGIEHSIGEVLLRYGVYADWLELRLAVLPINLKQSDGTTRLTAQGVQDLYVGAKFALTPQDGWLPEMALTPQFTVPTGSSTFNGGDVHYGLNWLYGWDITDEWSFAGSTQFNRGLDNFGQHFVEFAQSLTVGHSFTETVGGYAEWFVLLPTRSEVGPSEHYFNGGITWKLSNDIQYDVRAGVGLNDAAADYFLGTGLALRFH